MFARTFLRLPALTVSATLLLFTTLDVAVAADSGSHPNAPVSPYFHIDGDDTGVDRLPLKKTSADIRLNGLMASVQLSQVYRNEGQSPINATYIFPGSTRAAVNGMTMSIGERRIVARIKEREQARQTFEKAKQAGKSASLLAQQRPNVFSMEVANILPGDEVTVTLTYTELLDAEDGIYEFVYPGVVGPRYGGDAALADGETRWIANPYLAEGTPDPVVYELVVNMQSPLPIASLESPSHTLDADWQDRHKVRLALADAGDAGNRDFILRYRLQDDRIVTGLSRFEAHDENYFMLVSEPPLRVLPQQIPRRDYFFVVDVSGSMAGFPLDTTRALMERLLKNLGPDDRFNILFFAGGSSMLSPQPLRASPENIVRASAMLANQRGGGGTELYPALQKVFDMPSDEHTSRNIVVITDGYISAEDRLFRLVDEKLHRNNLFAFGIGSSVNRYLIEGLARAGRAESFVVTNRREAASQARKFNAYIAAPALTQVQVTAEHVELYDMEPKQVPDMLAQRPVVVIGKYRNAGANAVISLRGINGHGEQQWSFGLDDAEPGDRALPQLWARNRLERLYVIPDEDKAQQRETILQLGLKYSLLTRHTSFVAVDETVRNSSGEADDVKQPLPLPAGVSNLAVGRPMPEPELVWLAAWLLLLTMVGRLWSQRRA